jgi:hypothetical protein
MSKKKIAIVLLWLTVLLQGCSSKTTDLNNTTNLNNAPSSKASTVSKRPSSTAKIAIVEPGSGSDVPSGTIHVRLELTGATVVSATSQDLRPDEGHVHLSLDGKLVSMTFGLEQDLQVAPGGHLVQAEFVASDHAPFDPRVIATVTFNAT